MKSLLKQIRDNPIILSILVIILKTCRWLGFFKSKKVYQHVPYRGIFTVPANQYGIIFKMEAHGSQLENAIFWEGLSGYESETMDTFIRFAKTSNVVFDIGANTGLFSLVAAAAGAKQVFAFEPVPRIFSILCKNVTINSMSTIRCQQLAVGNADSQAILFDPGGAIPYSASLSQTFSSRCFGNNLTEISVFTVTVDSFVKNKKINNINLIKLDVEGYEEEVLKGMKQTVIMYSPIIIIEVLDEYEDKYKKLVESLWPSKYEWKRIDEADGSRNVLLLPLN